MKRVVLLGTGTDVGKTYVGSMLLRTWARRGPCLGLKPVESGVVPGRDEGTDAVALAGTTALLDRPLQTGSHPDPRHFLALPEPISPHLAARRAGVALDLQAAAEWVRSWEKHYTTLHHSQEFLSLVETAGGAFSPMTETETCADFATRLEPAHWILVAPDSLGVLHDVRATLTALAVEHRRVDLVVLSAARPADPSTGSNAAELEKVVFPLLGARAPRCSRVLVVERGGEDVTELADLLAALPGSIQERSSRPRTR